ncbi:glutamine synthetase family protein [Carnimonas bestiolae]|uniref:glutamine synthetase family protein n=1 Tax=Carnimonas bestiolae TaxID=3402172 RepID=UPI003EDC3AFE
MPSSSPVVSVPDSVSNEQQAPEPAAGFAQEVARYLELHPDTVHVDLLLADLNGIFRGKRLPVDAVKKLVDGCYLPSSIFAMDLLGNVVEKTGLGLDAGEPDLLCKPVLGTLVPVATDPDHNAQLLLTMLEEDGSAHRHEPRNVLANVWQQLKDRGLHPVVAVELEFYLLDRQRSDDGELQPPCSPTTHERSEQAQVYSLDNLDEFSCVLEEIDRLAAEQGLAAEGAVAEASPGQFEINLHHSQNILKACDDALMLKRLIRQVAERHGLQATFMAKPYSEHAGNGMHIHISLVDDAGNNVLSDDDLENTRVMEQALSGMLALMPDSMALFAPNVNSYRRFQPGMYVSTQASWGYNNRTVALRIPRSGQRDYRIEHRVAGADANPYLVVAALVASVLYGLDNALPLPAPIEGNGLDSPGIPLPIREGDALARLAQSSALAQYLGESFIESYRLCKEDELNRFEREITDLELDWLLKLA